MTRLGTISPLIFQDSLIISLTKDWMSLFNCIPEFEGKIDKDGKLHLVSKQKIKRAGADLCE